MQINDAGLALIKKFEGFRAKAYQDSVGVWTIGYGTTARAGVGITPRAGMVISEGDAEYYLERAINKFIEQIEPTITQPINENQFAAFVSLAYNIGPGAFKRSTALSRFNRGDTLGAADAITMWNKAGGRVLKGLTRRRAAEKKLFLTPVSAPKTPAHPDPAEKPVGGLAGLIRALLALFGK